MKLSHDDVKKIEAFLSSETARGAVKMTSAQASAFRSGLRKLGIHVAKATKPKADKLSAAEVAEYRKWQAQRQSAE